MTNWQVLANRYFDAECACCAGDGRVRRLVSSGDHGWEKEVSRACRECDTTGRVLVDIHDEDPRYKATCLCAGCSADDEPALPTVAPEIPAEWRMWAS